MFQHFSKGVFIIYDRSGGGELEAGAKISRPIVMGGGGPTFF